jgi:hypothetical protein
MSISHTITVQYQNLETSISTTELIHGMEVPQFA